jgi:diketogulonate reductase-like aldo/keto reductase
MKEIAKKKGATIPQIALSWITSRPLHIAIPAALSIEEIEQNAVVGDIKLSWEEIEAISQVSIELDDFTYAFDHYIVRHISWIKEALKNIIIQP